MGATAASAIAGLNVGSHPTIMAVLFFPHALFELKPQTQIHCQLRRGTPARPAHYVE
jgi:hypothetical protein